MMEPEFKALDAQLARLSREVIPPRDLWPGIVAGIARKHRDARSIAFAAVAACALFAGVSIWAVLHGGATTRLPLVVAAPGGFAEPSNVKYAATRTVLEATFRERLALLDPVTRTQVEASLAVIKRAHEDIRKALAAEPSNAVLEQLFESTWHDEFDLYDHVVRATQLSLTRI
ncbi:MAG: hypothetical protein QOD56_2363 [Gammaproteobacteria bacterium]|jgi:hypothetical protein|nr:hypothetical protein [Gammaproteobacteria bacterium]